MSETKQISAAERAAYFALATRQNWQMCGRQKVTSGGSSMTIEIPKARYLSNIYLRLKVKLNAKHATKTNIPLDDLTVFRILRRISLNLNVGFQPFVFSGVELGIYNMINMNSGLVSRRDTEYISAPDNFTASAQGTDNTHEVTFQIPTTLNKRDITGLILLQNSTTSLNIVCDIANGNELFPYDNAGLTIDIKEVEAITMVETFSIPENPNYRPDLSMVKLCLGQAHDIVSAGQQTFKLPTGAIYRKLMLFVTDKDGRPAENNFFTSDIALTFNQADTNYNIDPTILRAMNEHDLNMKLPKGVYIFDFSNQGMPNFGGTRDIIDSRNLTELWIKFAAAGAGKVDIFYENLVRVTSK